MCINLSYNLVLQEWNFRISKIVIWIESQGKVQSDYDELHTSF